MNDTVQLKTRVRKLASSRSDRIIRDIITGVTKFKTFSLPGWDVYIDRTLDSS
jgi:hypothetical protein